MFCPPARVGVITKEPFASCVSFRSLSSTKQTCFAVRNDMNDLSRVFLGTRLVVQALSRTKGFNNDTTRWERLRHHASEILEKAMLQYEGSNKNDTPTSSTHSSNDADDGQNTPLVESPKDLIGFSKVKNDDVNDEFNLIASTNGNSIMREQPIPSSQFSRVVGFGSLGARLAFGAARDTVLSAFNSNGASRKSMSDESAEQLAETLCRMRGAALKLGQMLSVQDEGLLPPALAKALERVKQNADYMPSSQLHNQLRSQLGTDWRSKFLEFDEKPIAAASIGQVHKAKLPNGRAVAVKIQYPGVARSIASDLNNLKLLVTMTNLVPRGLYIDEIMRVAAVELAEECDYLREASYQRRYRNLIINDPLLCEHTYVPEIFDELTTGTLITSEFVNGVSIDKAHTLPASVRNAIARTMLILTMKELFEWRFVQSDPNFANYLYDHRRRSINCIDFGASREYSKEFVDGYIELVWAAANKDREALLSFSRKLGFLNGDEHQDMTSAHIEAALIVGEPFINNDPYDFGNSSLTQKISQYGNTFMKYRLTPPPTEAYSLHRKLAGAFLLCIKLKACIPCRDILEAIYEEHVRRQSDSR